MNEHRNTCAIRALTPAATLAILASSATAGPSLPVTKPPIVGPPNTGPFIDPPASAGQWFLDANGVEEFRPFEFHDNAIGFGGGFASTLAIEGRFGGYIRDAANSITGYRIVASITNDTNTVEGQWLPGTNSHQEANTINPRYVGTLFDTKLTVEFADDGVRGNWFPDAAGQGDEPNVFAQDYDQLAWYSFTETGAYQVPTYDFGDIPVGQTVTRTLSFGLYNPIFDPNGAIPDVDPALDLFLNRTTSLKISNYFEPAPFDILQSLALPVVNYFDDGTPYPDIVPDLGSNVSVFHNIPSPGGVALLAASGLVAGLRRRR